jgi:RNA polymerase sigma-70 factor (ECF subfamily)
MSLRALFDRLYPALVRYLSRRLGDRDLAEDLAQEAFVRLLAHQPPAPEAWLFRVATNLANDAARGDLRRTRRLQLLSHGERTESAPPADRHVLQAETAAQVQRGLALLSERDRALLLFHEEGMSYRELAATVGVNPSSIAPLLARARARFLRHYHASQPDGQHAAAPG